MPAALAIDFAPAEAGHHAPTRFVRRARPAAVPGTGDDPASALPLHVAIRGATVLIDDARTGLTWRAEPVDIAIERGPDSISGDFSLAMTLGASKPELHGLSAIGRMPALDLDLSLDGVRPADIPALVPELAPLRQIEAALSGRLQHADRPRRRHGRGPRLDVAIGQGRLRASFCPGGVAIEGGELHAAYDPETGSCASTAAARSRRRQRARDHRRGRRGHPRADRGRRRGDGRIRPGDKRRV